MVVGPFVVNWLIQLKFSNCSIYSRPKHFFINAIFNENKSDGRLKRHQIRQFCPLNIVIANECIAEDNLEGEIKLENNV